MAKLGRTGSETWDGGSGRPRNRREEEQVEKHEEEQEEKHEEKHEENHKNPKKKKNQKKGQRKAISDSISLLRHQRLRPGNGPRASHRLGAICRTGNVRDQV
ncbi:hypothetical protein METBIDRAFT_181920 [Metschnikowia bicuspidata var. bicuspidata NRRL YB-4993]|uniref:Uncharacterized protein n=1 Tax=Metschnikowia bicuspidata var. bicuspidata NRRL YB-4993 TaxID=869754 RepID=A0A1A0HBV2_9ASCO|nr:hypothetical protein METBIDRAFT_181920 [Metschnikowia bicuspidata var. bicuspidata NRRL YB-4993]OBA21368.1 hypothetical protein METBIDRAFT_181920 [Metschnikowia bicuspidata var. bicuspidata NRRL YB-4993]